MLETGGGSIINTASIGGIVAEAGKTAYGVAKAGIMALTRSIATQYGKQNIRCNAIAPGMVLSDAMVENASDKLRQSMEIFERQKCTPRIGSPVDIANLAVFLASGESSFITGQTINADGGMLAHNPTVADLSAMGSSW